MPLMLLGPANTHTHNPIMTWHHDGRYALLALSIMAYRSDIDSEGSKWKAEFQSLPAVPTWDDFKPPTVWNIARWLQDFDNFFLHGQNPVLRETYCVHACIEAACKLI